jgi:hypothetical protein
MNHRFLLRLVTNFAVFLLILSCFGIVLWVTDEILMWDILPEAWSLLVRALLIAGGIIAVMMVTMNFMLAFALLAEANASRAALPDYTVSRQTKRRIRNSIIAGILAIALLVGGLQITNQVRAQVASQTARTEFDQAHRDLDQSMQQVLGLFTPSLLEALETNTLAEKGQIGDLAKLFNAIQSSFAHSPAMVMLMPATQPPFKYMRMDVSSILSSNTGKLSLSPQLFTNFPSERENQAVEQLFASQLPAIDGALPGKVIDNTVPSSWGILKRNGKAIAIVYLASTPSGLEPYILPGDRQDEFHHNGPESLISNG